MLGNLYVRVLVTASAASTSSVVLKSAKETRT